MVKVFGGTNIVKILSGTFLEKLLGGTPENFEARWISYEKKRLNFYSLRSAANF